MKTYDPGALTSQSSAYKIHNAHGHQNILKYKLAVF